MKNPDYFFKIHFNQPDFSIAEVTAFAEDHQARLVERFTGRPDCPDSNRKSTSEEEPQDKPPEASEGE